MGITLLTKNEDKKPKNISEVQCRDDVTAKEKVGL